MKAEKFKRGCTVGKQQSGTMEVCDEQTFDEALDILTPKEEAFVLEYIKDFNGTRAAIQAGYSAKTARSIASENLTKPDIERALFLFYMERRKNAKKTVDDIEKRLESIGFTDLTDVISFTRDGQTFAKDSEDLPEDAKATLKKVKFSENMSGISVEVEQHDKVGALKLLGQQKGMFQQRVKADTPAETYEQRRKRLGLDDMTAQGAYDKLLREIEARMRGARRSRRVNKKPTCS